MRMTRRRLWIGFNLSLVAGFLLGCGGGAPVASKVPVQPAQLAGNWLLVGKLVAAPTAQSAPSVAVTIDVTGAVLTAAGKFNLPCSNDAGGLGGFGYGAALTGAVAPDGNFTITSPVLTGAVSIPSVTLSGTVPQTTGGEWKGTYTVKGGTALCTYSDSGAFTAAPIGDVAGTYAGAGNYDFFPVNSSHSTEQALSLRVDLTQGGLLSVSGTASPQSSKLALNGSVAIQGIKCFSKGTTSAGAQSLVLGSEFAAAFDVDDGSRVFLTGELLTEDASQVSLLVVTVLGGDCAGNYISALTPIVLKR